jgi:tRNA threonylcarbamoyl adenosine modification protein (Sua5/YciO/YrdC/YwlC family)
MFFKIYPENPNEKSIAKAVEMLKNGGVIIYPTDSVYAVGCDIFQQKAVERVCKLKNIDIKKSSLSLICSDLSNISTYAKVSNNVFKLLKRNLPGAFTFILNGSSNLPKILKHRKTIGIRIPQNNIILQIVRELGNPIFTTSIKSADEISEYETDTELLIERYENTVDLLIDGGFIGNTPSTIVDCTEDEPIIVRQGKGILN